MFPFKGIHESSQEQATRGNRAACVCVKSIGELFAGLQRGIKVEEQSSTTVAQKSDFACKALSAILK